MMSSCSNVIYNTAVPKDQKSIDKFPKKLQGIYVDEESDTLKIMATKYSYGEINNNALMEGELGSDLVLKEYKDYYFLNFRNDDGYWEMIAATVTRKKIYLLSIDIENKSEVKKLNKHMKKGHAKNIRKDDKFLINPENDELLNMLNDSSICQKTELIKIK